MGRNNQKRRADKQRRADRRGHRTSSYASSASAPDDRWGIESLAVMGGRAAAFRSHGELDSVVAALVSHAESAGRARVSASVGRVVCDTLADAWERGWQPSEVARQVRRARRGSHGDVIVAAMGAPGSWAAAGSTPMPDAWSQQLVDLGAERSGASGTDWIERWRAGERLPLADAFRVVLETLGVLMVLPPVEPLQARPGEWRLGAGRSGRPADDPVLAKIRALLAKAESTNFEPEAEAFTAKAQELMARHSIDDAMTRAASLTPESPTARRVAVDDPYAVAKSRLLQVVAVANGVRCVWYDDLAMMALVGFGADVEAVEVLFTSLLVQASQAMRAKGSVRDGRGRSRTRSFRQSFILAFASRIRERLAAAADRARQVAESEVGRSLLPVLADREREVGDAVHAMFPHLVMGAGPVATNEAGWRAGRISAELATLGPLQGSLDTMTAAG